MKESLLNVSPKTLKSKSTEEESSKNAKSINKKQGKRHQSDNISAIDEFLVRKLPPNISQNYDFLYKVALIGDSGCGKTSLLLRYCCGSFDENMQSTIGVDFKMTSLQIDNYVVKLQLWDTCGSERFKSITSSFLKSCSAFILVFDLTDTNSFSNLRNWIKSITDASKAGFYCLIGNKCDITNKRIISRGEALSFAEYYGLHYVETSAKENINIDKVFAYVSKLLYSQTQSKRAFLTSSYETEVLSLSPKTLQNRVEHNQMTETMNLLLSEKQLNSKEENSCSC